LLNLDVWLGAPKSSRGIFARRVPETEKRQLAGDSSRVENAGQITNAAAKTTYNQVFIYLNIYNF
jgi:hypothetical protein